MKPLPLILACAITALAVSAGVAVAQSSSAGGLTSFRPEMTQQAQRDCLFPDGGWTIVNPDTVTAASSGTLNAFSRYIVQCRADSYVSFGGTTADSSDGYLPAGTMLPFMTGGSGAGYSVLNVTADSDCRHIECK
jgi:hypothetical protein